MTETTNQNTKILCGVDEAARLAERIRRAGKSIVLTNGCFDLLHVGHTRSIEDARTLGDYLFVGINSDGAVRKLKGEGQPVTPEGERAEILAALEAVDFVFVFDDLTADAAILAIKPDVHAKGADYTEQNDPERESVLSYGGRVAIVGDPKSHSTQDILSRLKS